MNKPLLATALILLLPMSARADDWVGFYGSYYKETSTRIVSPMVMVNKDLPADTQLRVTYLIDQITSASAAFTPTDEAFQEYRQEVRLQGSKAKIADVLGLTLNGRYSHEPDYTSWAVGGGLSLDLFDEQTTLAVNFQYQNDDVFARGREGFRDDATTLLASVHYTQILTRRLLMSLCLETQSVRGYQENVYRVEQHPRERNRYTVGISTRYRIPESRTTLRLDTRAYSDTWENAGYALDFFLTQRIVSSLEVTPRIRFAGQTGVFFTDLKDGFRTTDPKLERFSSQFFALQLSWRLSVLGDTALSPFQNAMIQPTYGLLRQSNRYGVGHVAQLGFFWPF